MWQTCGQTFVTLGQKQQNVTNFCHMWQTRGQNDNPNKPSNTKGFHDLSDRCDKSQKVCHIFVTSFDTSQTQWYQGFSRFAPFICHIFLKTADKNKIINKIVSSFGKYVTKFCHKLQKPCHINVSELFMGVTKMWQPFVTFVTCRLNRGISTFFVTSFDTSQPSDTKGFHVLHPLFVTFS